MTLRILFAALLFVPATSVVAQGFATRDLAGLAKDMERTLGPGFTSRTEDGQVALSCLSCPGSPIVGVALGRQDDGTEQRVREGKTTIEQLRAQCRARDSRCELTALKVAPANGWITSYRMGSMAGATAVIIRDGDLLTIRSLSEDSAVARANAVKMTSFARRSRFPLPLRTVAAAQPWIGAHRHLERLGFKHRHRRISPSKFAVA